MGLTKKVIIIGSSGMIGNTLLNLCLNNEKIEQITIINRKPSNINNTKLNEIIHTDFMNFDSIKHQFQNQDICFYCLGVYTGQVPKSEFNKITIDYTKSFADALKQESPQATFCFLSGQGADSTEKSTVLFAKAKGIAENYLLSLQFNKTYIFRPGYIYPIIPRQEPNNLYKLFRILYKPLSVIYPNIGITSLQLAQKMLDISLVRSNEIIFENKALISH